MSCPKDSVSCRLRNRCVAPCAKDSLNSMRAALCLPKWSSPRPRNASRQSSGPNGHERGDVFPGRRSRPPEVRHDDEMTQSGDRCWHPGRLDSCAVGACTMTPWARAGRDCRFSRPEELRECDKLRVPRRNGSEPALQPDKKAGSEPCSQARYGRPPWHAARPHQTPSRRSLPTIHRRIAAPPAPPAPPPLATGTGSIPAAGFSLRRPIGCWRRPAAPSLTAAAQRGQAEAPPWSTCRRSPSSCRAGRRGTG